MFTVDGNKNQSFFLWLKSLVFPNVYFSELRRQSIPRLNGVGVASASPCITAWDKTRRLFIEGALYDKIPTVNFLTGQWELSSPGDFSDPEESNYR